MKGLTVLLERTSGYNEQNLTAMLTISATTSNSFAYFSRCKRYQVNKNSKDTLILIESAREKEKHIKDKEVLLRERKRHTGRCISSTHCAAPSPGGGGYLPWVGGTYPDWGGYLLWLGVTYPSQRVPTLAEGYLP